MKQAPSLLHQFQIQALENVIETLMEELLHFSYPYKVRASDDGKLEILCVHPFRIVHQCNNLYTTTTEVGKAIDEILIMVARNCKTRLLYKSPETNFQMIIIE